MFHGFERRMMRYSAHPDCFDYLPFWEQVRKLNLLIQSALFRNLWISSRTWPCQIEGYLSSGEYVYFSSKDGRHCCQIALTRWHQKLLFSFSYRTSPGHELSERETARVIEFCVRMYLERKHAACGSAATLTT